jgi:hypothetical protein
MEFITSLLESRCSRANLDTTKEYMMVKKVNGKNVETDVGLFVRAYRMGSGDGMTIHWEFLKDSVTIVIDDAMWGSIEGSELVGFKTK